MHDEPAASDFPINVGDPRREIHIAAAFPFAGKMLDHITVSQIPTYRYLEVCNLEIGRPIERRGIACDILLPIDLTEKLARRNDIENHHIRVGFVQSHDGCNIFFMVGFDKPGLKRLNGDHIVRHDICGGAVGRAFYDQREANPDHRKPFCDHDDSIFQFDGSQVSVQN
nr:hypothetical protein [Kozakia baliensis]